MDQYRAIQEKEAEHAAAAAAARAEVAAAARAFQAAKARRCELMTAAVEHVR